MNELSNYTAQLPDTIEDLSKFVLYQESRIQGIRNQIKMISKVNVARDVYEQKLAEAQEIGQVAVEAAQKMGELLLQIQKQSGARTDLTSPTDAERLKSKTEIISNMGMTTQQVSQYQQMAQNPEAVQAAIQKAIERGDVVSRSQVMKEIKAIKDQMAAKDRELAELRNKPPETIVKEVEVVPEDYEKIKSDLESARYTAQRAEKDFSNIKEKYFDAQKENEQLRARLEVDTQKRQAEADVQHFTIMTNDYLRKYGGHVWVFNEIESIDEAVKIDFIKAIKALDGFAQQLLRNLGGNLSE